MESFSDGIKYPYDMLGFTMYEDYGICKACGGRVERRGIIGWANHYAQCWGKQQCENVMKIKDMPLTPQDKMDLVKKEFNINQ